MDKQEKLLKLKNVLSKASSLEKGKELALAKEFIDLDSKIEKIEQGVGEINVSVDKKLSDISEELKKKLEEELNYEIDPEEIRGEKGERGEQGEKGDKGEQGEAGKDGKDGRDGLDGKDGVDGQNGLPGANGSPDTPKQIKEKLETLKKDKRLDKSAIKGLEEYVDKPHLDRAISILDQRTQFLINKQVDELRPAIPYLELPITQADLYDLVATDSLEVGAWYLITDFQHKTIVAGTENDALPVITTGAVEQIYVKAESTSTFNQRAYSKTYSGEELVFKTFGNTLYQTNNFSYSLGDETYLSITDTDELTFVSDMFPEGFTSMTFRVDNYDTGTYVTFTEADYGTKWTFNNSTKKFTNLYGMLSPYYTEYYDGEPSSLGITVTGQYTFTCATDELDTFSDGYLYFTDNDSGDGGEVYAIDRGVTWDYDTSTHTFTLLNADTWGDGNFSFENDWYGEFNFYTLVPSDWSDSADISIEGSATTIYQEFNGKIVERRIMSQDFRFAGDYRSQLTRRYKVLCDDWAAGTYTAGTVVRHSSTIWVATVETTDTPSTTTAINWMRVCADDYVLAATIIFSGLFNFTLTIDPATYYDYPVLDLTRLSACRNSVVKNNTTADEINVVFLNQIVNSTVDTTGSTFTEAIANSNIIANSGYFSALTDVVGSFNTVFSNGISYSNIGYMQTCLLNNSITRNTIVSMSGVYCKGSMTDNTISYMSSVVLYSYIQNSVVLKLVSTMFLNYIEELYIANLYNCTFSDYTYRTQFFGRTYYNNFLGRVLNNSIFGTMYGSSNAVRQTIGYFAQNTILTSMSLNYLSAGFNFDNNFIASLFSNNFSAAVPAENASRFRNNVCMGIVSNFSGAGQFYFYNNVCLGAVNGLTLSNSGYRASVQGNTFIGDMGSAGGGWVFNNTTEAVNVRFNLFKKSSFSWTVTRGTIEYNEFGSSFTNILFGNTATYTFSYNVIGDGYSNNSINANMSYNILPSGWTGKTITSSNTFNNLTLTKAYGNIYRPTDSTGNALETDSHITVNASGGARTITLLATVASGRTVMISKVDSSANAVIVAPSGTNTIEGASSISLRQQNETIWLQDTLLGDWKIINWEKNIVQGSLTATRVPFADANGRLVDDADLTFATDTLTVTKVKGQHLSSDGTAGITQTITFNDYNDETHTLVFKDGILTSYTAP